jgi:hypothetical protein
MSNDETKLYNKDGAVAEAGADGVQAGHDARGVGPVPRWSWLSARFRPSSSGGGSQSQADDGTADYP